MRRSVNSALPLTAYIPMTVPVNPPQTSLERYLDIAKPMGISSPCDCTKNLYTWLSERIMSFASPEGICTAFSMCLMPPIFSLRIAS